MKMDPGSNYQMISGMAPAEVSTGDHETDHVDHAEVASASFLVDVGDVGDAGKVDAKLQYSDDAEDWEDEPDGDAGNDTSIEQMDATGQARVDVPNPRGRYTRLKVTVAENAVTMAVTAVAGPRKAVRV